MNTVGAGVLALSWLCTLYAVFSCAVAGGSQKKSYLVSGRNSAFLGAALCIVSVVILGVLFANGEFANNYVWQFSNRDMPWIYKITAIWGGMDGSMLLWCAILAGCVLIVVSSYGQFSLRLYAWTLSILSSSLLFFLTVTLFLTNPFRFLGAEFIPPDGNGLNPLLQNPYMAIHPPMLYLGFTALTVPYAFCLGALCANETSNEWIRLTRVWTLAAWAFLTIGITLGGYWAYIELGWGGFWAWDPVENASFLPWLTATAFLHSVMVQERKNMLRFWNVWLVVLSYGLTVFGTFLTRSGVVESVHAFASTDVGWVFLLYLGIVVVFTAYLCYLRRDSLRSERTLESFFSRESAFLINNLVFLSICFATFWGVMFPVFSEALSGEKQALGVPFFNAVNVPLFLLLIFLMGIGPLVAWRKARLKQILSTFTAPFVIAVIASLLLFFAGIDSFYAVVSYGLCFFVGLTILGEFHRGVKSKRRSGAAKNVAQATGMLFRSHRQRYAGHLVHLGVLVATIGITASMAHKVEDEFFLKIGETYSIGRHVVQLKSVEEINLPNYFGMSAVVDHGIHSLDDPSKVDVLAPELRVYRKNQENTSEVSIRKKFLDDFYLVLAGFDPENQKASFKVYINPLQSFLWAGVFIMMIGTIVTLLPKRDEQELLKARAAAAAAGGES